MDFRYIYIYICIRESVYLELRMKQMKKDVRKSFVAFSSSPIPTTLTLHLYAKFNI